MKRRDFLKTASISTAGIVLANLIAGQTSAADKFPDRTGQLDNPVKWFFSGEKRYGFDIKYAGKKTQDAKLTLTAGNCFWDGSIRANGQTPITNKNDSPFIKFDYEYLANWTSSEQNIRWHIWCGKPGKIKAVVDLEVSKTQAGSIVEVSLAGKTVSVKTTANSNKKTSTQPWNIIFNVPKKGKYTLSLRARKITTKDIGKLRGIELSGSAIEGASLLRARWRPAAVHGRIWSSKVKDAKIWVVQSKTAKGCSSYSPITTPFGYYGASFDADGRTSTGMNFSMWSYGRNKEEPPIERLSHLIAVGSPDATFGGFGHEGTGVKLRGDWKPLAAKPEILTQALRLVPGETYDTYYGYFLDPDTGKWKFFAAGRKWHKPSRGHKHLSSPGSFVEVPGPPDRQRSGDVRREGFIRGWVPDSTGKWHRLDTASKGRDNNANKTWAFVNDGWYSKSMGGMEHFDHGKSNQLTMPKSNKPLPEFLNPASVKELYKVPAEFETKVLDVTSKTAKIQIDAKDAGTNATAIIYYGPKEGLTFADRWQQSKNIASVKNMRNTVTVTGLKPATEYFYRVLLSNDHGKIWSIDTLKFKTK